MLGGAALLVGLTSGMGVWLFKRLIDLAHLAAYDELGAALSRLGSWTIALVPVAGGLVVGLIMHFLVGEERHHGVAGVMEAVALGGGRLQRGRDVFVLEGITVGEIMQTDVTPCTSPIRWQWPPRCSCGRGTMACRW